MSALYLRLSALRWSINERVPRAADWRGLLREAALPGWVDWQTLCEILTPSTDCFRLSLTRAFAHWVGGNGLFPNWVWMPVTIFFTLYEWVSGLHNLGVYHSASGICADIQVFVRSRAPRS